MPNYKKPPVVEAVIEVRIGGQPLDDKSMEALVKRFGDRYPTPPMPQQHINFELAGTDLRVSQQNLGFKIQSVDLGFTVILGRDAIATSRNAPYLGWEQFMEEARANWSEWRKVVSWRELARIGLRYINRIDVPVRDMTDIIQLEDYFVFTANAPVIPDFGAMRGFGITAEIRNAEKNVTLIINHSPTPSPLVKANSFVLDLDLGIDHALPTNEKTLWEIIEGLRSVKNSVFEACITDRTRELFS